jgi:dipeptidyl aminopeptidase/acylaminoacyl peptidase
VVRLPFLALAVVAAFFATASRAEVPATCGAAPTFHAGPLGAVAYVSDGALHVVDLSSRRDRTLARVSVPQYGSRSLAWSADGRWLSAGNLLIPAAGGSFCNPFGAQAMLHWSPNGETLAATTAQGVFIATPNGKPHKLLPAGWSADGFGPGGGRLAAESGLRLWSVAVATGRRTLLYGSPNVHVSPSELARWTPDGRWVLFWTDTEGSASLAADGLPLLAVPAGGGQAVALAQKVQRTPQFVVPCDPGHVLVVSGFDRYVSAHKSLQLFSDGSWARRDISADPSHSWYDPSCSPDGRSIAATATLMPGDEDGFIDSSARMIWLLSPDGSRRVLLGAPHAPVSFEGARFSRDGRYLLYLEHPTRYGAPLQLHLLDLATGRSSGSLATIGGGGLDYYGLHDWAGVAAWYQP